VSKTIRFDAIRSDWYSNNSVLPPLFRKAIKSSNDFIFEGFPRQWIPIFEYFGIPWKSSLPPKEYIPFFSELSEKQLLSIIENARKNCTLRNLVESTSMLDPVLSDFLYIIDNTLDVEIPGEKNELNPPQEGIKRPIKLNGWQSYGRKSIKDLETEIKKITPRSNIAVALPCALRRPYNLSKTHRRIYKKLEDIGYNIKILHKIVVTALGIIPEELWSLPQVLYYDAGVPDIYRILRLARDFFKRCQYSLVIDCLTFEPYSDVLRIVQREGLIKELKKVKISKKRHFYIRP